MGLELARLGLSALLAFALMPALSAPERSGGAPVSPPEPIGERASEPAKTASAPFPDPADGSEDFEREVHPVHGQVLRFKDARGEFFYAYDPEGRLLEARRVDGAMARLAYDAREQVSKLLIQDHAALAVQELQIRYDDQGRMLQLHLLGRGSIRASYDAAGKMQLSHPGLGPEDALKIFGMFGTLRMLTHPAGIVVLQPPSQAQPAATGPVELWLTPPPDPGRLESCGLADANRPWVLAQKHALLTRLASSQGESVRVGRLGPDGGRDDWLGQCFRLRRGPTVLWQGVLVPAGHAQALALPVLELENRARQEPRLTLSCGLPAGAGPGPGSCTHPATGK